MGRFRITDNQTGDTLTIEADREPTQAEVEGIFAEKKRPFGVKEDLRTAGVFKPTELSPTTEFTESLAPLAVGAAREIPEVIGKFAGWVPEKLDEAFTELAEIQRKRGLGPGEMKIPSGPAIPMPPEEEKGVLPAAQRFVSPMTTLGGAATFALAPESRLVRGLFGATAGVGAYEAAKALTEARTAAEQREAGTTLGLNLALGGLMLKPHGAEGATEAAPVETPTPKRATQPAQAATKPIEPSKPEIGQRISTTFEEYDEPRGEWVKRTAEGVISKSTSGPKPWRVTLFGGSRENPTPIAHVDIDSPAIDEATRKQIAEQLGRYVRNLDISETVKPSIETEAPSAIQPESKTVLPPVPVEPVEGARQVPVEEVHPPVQPGGTPAQETVAPARFKLVADPERIDGIIESDQGNITLRAVTSQQPNGEHVVTSLMAFVPPGILDPRIAPRTTIDLRDRIAGKTAQEARENAYKALTEEINKGNFDVLTPAPKAPEAPETPNVETYLKMPVRDAGDARQRVRAIEARERELVDERKKLEEKLKGEEALVKIVRGPKWKRGRIKQSAKTKDLEALRETEKQLRENHLKLLALSEAKKPDQAIVDDAVDAQIINDPKQPLLRRIDRVIRRMEDAKQPVPKELLDARWQETVKVVRRKYPDATDEEINSIASEIEREQYFYEDPFQSLGAHNFDLFARRKHAVATAFQESGLPESEASPELTERLKPIRYSADIGQLTAKEAADLQKQIARETKAYQGRKEAEAKRQAEVEAAEKAKEAQLIADAQKVVDSVPRPRDAKLIRAELVQRLETAMDEVIESAKVKVTKHEGNEYIATSESENMFAMADIVPEKKGFKVTFTAGGPHKISVGPTTVATMEDAMRVLKAAASSVPTSTRVIIAVPGDGIYRLLKHGPTLLNIWKMAKSLDVTKGHEPTKSSAPSISKEDKADILAEAKEFAAATEIEGKYYAKRGKEWWRIQQYDATGGKLADEKLSPVLDKALIEKLEGREPEKIEVGDEVSWPDPTRPGKLARASVRQIQKLPNDPEPMAFVDWFGEKRVPLSNLTIVKKNPVELNRRQMEEIRKKNPPIKGREPLEQRISGKSKQQDPFTMDEGDLADLFEERFGEKAGQPQPGEFGRTDPYSFPTYDAFKKWMDERYAERDLEGMKLAFAAADTPSKIRYIKENKAEADHKKSWIAHLATGADIPKTDPPVPRTTPRPLPRGGAAPVPPTPARPAEPPPPPREPSKHRKFDIMALTQLFRQFSKFPVVNERLKRAYGQFRPATEAVELKKRLLWDTDLAERVLGHEIGHFIDLIVPIIGKGKQLAQRLKPMFDFKGQMWRAKELRNDARDLSRKWRGDFPNGDKYRDSANELFADFMSAMFNNPEWVNQNYPRLYDAFQELRDAKPQFKSAYREIETWLQGGTMADEWMAQQRKAVERTQEIMLQKPERERASFRDRLWFDLGTLWDRAFQIEGKPRHIGSAISEKLETSYLWAAQQLSLWHDTYLKTVQRHLDQVSKDPLEAQTHLLSYSQAVRTIGERRAAGVWIERNPDEARDMLTQILNMDSGLREKFGQQLNSAPDSALYDLSAAIFREAHDRGERYIKRLSRAIDRMDLGIKGEAALMAFNVRGKLLDPGGLTPERANEVLRNLRDKLTPEQFSNLEDAATGLRDLMFDVQSEMHQHGLISDKTWKELIEPNKDNYLPYAVLDYFDGKVKAGVMPQKGTAKDVADVSAATQLKTASAFAWLQRQRQVELLRDVYARGGVNAPVSPRRLRRASDIDRIRAQNPHDAVSRAVLWVDGAPHLIEFPRDPGKLLQDALNLPEFYNHIEWLHDASAMTHKVMQVYTQLSPRFLLWRNIIRGVRTGMLKVGFLPIAKQLALKSKWNLRLARNYADAAFGGEMLPEVRQLVESEALPPPRLAAGMVRDLDNLRELMAKGMVPAFSTRPLRPEAEGKAGKIKEASRQALNATQKAFTTYEAFEKIYNYQAALDRGLTPEKAAAVARRGGIPKPGVSGKWSSAMEIAFPWSRVRTQGLRATYQMMRDPELGKGFVGRFLISEALPRAAKVALATGVISGAIKWLLPSDTDENDSVMGEFLKRVSPYKMALDDLVPLYFYDPRTGKTHYLWEFKRGKDIPSHYEAVSMRLPASEEGQVWGTMMYSMMMNAPGVRAQLGQPGQTMLTDMGRWAMNYFGPGLSPVIKTGNDLNSMILLGRNPIDPFRGTPSANPQLFDVGGVPRAEAIAGYTLNQLGGIGELGAVMAGNFGILDKRALESLSRRLPGDVQTWYDRVPYAAAVLSHDNYSTYRTEKMSELEEKQVRAEARLLMSPDVRGLYDFYWKNLHRQEKLDATDTARFNAAAGFIQYVWGNTKEGLYNTAVNALKDGSKESKATIKRDLDQAALPYLAAYRTAGEKPTP